jgi:hypothetical protein
MASEKRVKRVVISVTNDLVTDQRVNRIATTLHNNGYEVLAVRSKFKDSCHIQRPYCSRKPPPSTGTIVVVYCRRLFQYLDGLP